MRAVAAAAVFRTRAGNANEVALEAQNRAIGVARQAEQSVALVGEAVRTAAHHRDAADQARMSAAAAQLEAAKAAASTEVLNSAAKRSAAGAAVFGTRAGNAHEVAMQSAEQLLAVMKQVEGLDRPAKAPPLTGDR